mgnify:CR=1 FL=1
MLAVNNSMVVAIAMEAVYSSTQQYVCPKGAHAVDHAERAMPETAVYHRSSVFKAEHGALQEISKKTVQKKQVYHLVKTHFPVPPIRPARTM